MSGVAPVSSLPVPLHALRSSPVTAMAPATWSFFIDVTLFCVWPDYRAVGNWKAARDASLTWGHREVTTLARV